ncbi:MAG TPA: GNAT family N-acetyltransferase [Acidimicrobiales bacterium]|nr:GNAT family N-acetyltransferase [Acidimicrobiales bacterium]
MDIELVTDVDRLQEFVDGWEALADLTAQPRCGGALVVGWARHMMGPGSELRVWVATDGDDVVGVLPFAAETMARGRLRLLPTTTDMMYGMVPIAHPDRAPDVADAIAGQFAEGAEAVDLASIFWLPEGSPWAAAFGGRLAEPDWVTMNMTRYSSFYTNIGDGIEAWLDRRHTEFRRTVRRRARRCEEQGFRRWTTVDPVEIMDRLPHLQSFYVRRQQERGGEGYRFDEDMVAAIGASIALSPPGRFALSILESDELVIGTQLVQRAGNRMSCWITGYDPEWSKVGPGIAALVEALDAGSQAGCEIADLGVGDQPYKDDLQDAAFELESVTWCRPRLARLLQLGAEAPPGGSTAQVGDADGSGA